MAAYAALVSLMNNIEQIQRHTRLPISLDKKQSESLLEKVNFLIGFLESYNYPAAREEMKDLESRITDVAYAAEDIIETYVVDRIHAHSSSSKGEIEILAQTEKNKTLLDQPDIEKLVEAMKISIIQPRSPISTTFSSSSIPVGNNRVMRKFKKTVPTTSAKNPTLSCHRGIENEIMVQTEKNSTPLYLQDIEKIMDDIDFIKEEAVKMGKSAVEDMQPRHPITPPSSSTISAGKNIMVGFDDQLVELMERLAGNQPSRQIIPVVGMGGIGKTTLAKTAYDKPFVVDYFDFRAWVSISQEYDFKRIVLGLLPNESSQMSDHELAERLHKSLCGRRYLVVLDDMWSVNAWNMIKLFLPDNKNGSRIIVTTRISSLADHLDTCSLKMKFLDEDESWILFCENAFVEEGCPLELEEAGRKIVENCKGLPLSIIVIGGLLAKYEWRKEYWEYIARDTMEILSLEEQCMKILSLSYQNLPAHLKPCFLYVGAFHEDEKIRTSSLINLWIAEGILKSNCSKDLEVLGREYLNDLISRNLILVHGHGIDGKVKYCMIHDLLRDICVKRAQNEKFMYTQKMYSHDEEQCTGSRRRITIQQSLSNKEYISQVLNTLKPESMARTLICDEFPEILPHQNLRLLRVLNITHHLTMKKGIYSSPDDVFQLVNVRFITLKVTGPITFPSSLCLLWNLQILIIRGITEVSIAPSEIWEMTSLRHLLFGHEVYLQNPPPSQQMKGREDDVIMKNLRSLKSIKNFKLSDEVVKRIPNIKKLHISYKLTGKELLEEQGLENLGLLENLKSLVLTFQVGTVSNLQSYLTFPNSLKKLSLLGCGLRWEDMPMISSLPHLEQLKLYFDAFIGPEWVLAEEVFCCLKILEIVQCTGLVHWIAEYSHFPCLENLKVACMYDLVEIPPSFGDIPTLQHIQVNNCGKSVIVSAKKILEEQEDLGDMDIRFLVVCDKDAEVEELASDNFLVETYG